MKRFILISMLVFVLGTPVSAADILGTFADYTYLLRQSFNVDTSDTGYLSDTIAHQFVRLSVITIVPITHGTKGIFYDTTIYHKDHYNLDTLIWDIYSVQWIHEDTIKTLRRVPQHLFTEAFEKMFPQSLLGEAQTPIERRPYFYDHLDDKNGKIFIYPAPIRNGDTLRIIAWSKVHDIVASDHLSNISQKYRSPIFHFAAYLIARAKQHPLVGLYRQDYQEAMAFAMTHGGGQVADTTR